MFLHGHCVHSILLFYIFFSFALRDLFWMDLCRLRNVCFRFSAATNISDTNEISASSTEIKTSSAPGQSLSPKPGTPISSSLTELTPVQPSICQAYTPLPSFPAQFSSKNTTKICYRTKARHQNTCRSWNLQFSDNMFGLLSIFFIDITPIKSERLVCTAVESYLCFTF